jgi:hypothetical protein
VGATGVTPTMGVVVAVPDRRQLDLPPRSLVSVVPQIRRWWRAIANPDRPSSDQASTESAFLRDMEPADAGGRLVPTEDMRCVA